MPQVRKEIADHWYLNSAQDANGQPKPLTLGTITFGPGQRRFVASRILLESRHTLQSFETALANGRLSVVSGGEVAAVAIEKPKPVVVAAESEPEPMAIETDIVDEPASEEKTTAEGSRRRRRQ